MMNEGTRWKRLLVSQTWIHSYALQKHAREAREAEHCMGEGGRRESR